MQIHFFKNINVSSFNIRIIHNFLVFKFYLQCTTIGPASGGLADDDFLTKFNTGNG